MASIHIHNMESMTPSAIRDALDRFWKPALPVDVEMVGHADGMVVRSGGKYFLDDVEITPEEGKHLFATATGIPLD
jgi:hypothetical protein